MKIVYIVALLVIVFMVGCATTQPEAASETPAETAPVAPVETAPVAPVEDVPVVEDVVEVTDAEQIEVDRLKTACENGAINICLVLKNRFGIDWPPAVAEEPVVADAEADVAEPTE